jgi:hypothetical protein
MEWLLQYIRSHKINKFLESKKAGEGKARKFHIKKELFLDKIQEECIISLLLR